MSRRLTILIVATMVFSACAMHRRPTSQLSNWAAVMALPTGEQVEAVLTDGRRVTGAISRVDPDQIIVGPVAVIVRRADIQSVWIIPREDSLFNGYLLGAIAGLAFGAVARAKGNDAVLIPAASTSVGSVVGAWLDRGWKGPPRRLVYRAIP